MEYNVVWLSSIFPSRFTLYSFLPRMTITGVACSFLPASFTREQREDWVMRWTDPLPARCGMAVTPTSTHTHTHAQEAFFVSGLRYCFLSLTFWAQRGWSVLLGLGPTIFVFTILERGNPWKGQCSWLALLKVPNFRSLIPGTSVS